MGSSSTTPNNSGKYFLNLLSYFLFRPYSNIVILDNHHKDPNNENMVISSKMIIEDFGGIDAIAKELKCDLKVSLS